VGTGSGILAIAAAKLGASRVIAIDIGPQRRFNRPAEPCTEPGEGDRLGKRRAASRSRRPFQHCSCEYPCRRTGADKFRAGRKVARGGFLVLSGILTEKEGIVVTGFAPFLLTLVETTREAEWSCLTFRLER